MAEATTIPTPETTAGETEVKKVDYSKINLAKIENAIIKNSHPTANIFPMMSGEEFDNLVYSIETLGFDKTKPIKRNAANQIVDGRNRQKAVDYINAKIDLDNKANKTTTPHVVANYEQIQGDDPALLESVMMDNFARRNLSSSQKAAVIVKAGIVSDAYAKRKDIKESGARVAGEMAEILAAQSGTNKLYVYKCRLLREKKQLNLLDQVAAGELTVMNAIKKMNDIEAGTPEGGEVLAEGDVTDMLGKKVPDAFKDFFKDADDFKAITAHLRDAKKGLTDLAARTSGVALAERTNEVNTMFAGLARLIRDTQPHAVCPHCDGKGIEPGSRGKEKPACIVCKGHTFLAKTTYDRFMKDGPPNATGEGAGETAPTPASGPTSGPKAKSKKKEVTVGEATPPPDVAPDAKPEPTPEPTPEAQKHEEPEPTPV